MPERPFITSRSSFVIFSDDFETIYKIRVRICSGRHVCTFAYARVYMNSCSYGDKCYDGRGDTNFDIRACTRAGMLVARAAVVWIYPIGTELLVFQQHQPEQCPYALVQLRLPSTLRVRYECSFYQSLPRIQYRWSRRTPPTAHMSWIV